MKYLILFTIVVISLVGCNNNNNIKYTYFDTGQVREKFVSFSKDRPDDFQAYLYSKDGRLLKTAEYRNGKRNGKAISYSHIGEIEEERSYVNDLLHGVTRIYNEKGEIKKEYLYIESKQVVYKEFSQSMDSSIVKFVNYSVDDKGQAHRNGQLAFDINSNLPINDLSFYYFIVSNDTINGINENYKVHLEFINKFPWNLELHVDQFGKQTKSTDDTQIFKSSRNKMEFNFNPEKTGENLFLGRLYITLDTLLEVQEIKQNYEFLVYHEYFVK